MPEVPIAELNARTEHVKLLDVQVLSDNWYVLRRVTCSLRRRDGQWQTMSREAYDRGNGAALLLFDPRRSTVVLTRQFRLPAFLNGCADGLLIETCAGLLDGDDPETCIRREAEEETGYRVRQPRKVFEAYMSPGSVTEKLHFFVAEYEPGDRIRSGGGLEGEGEDIEVIEMPLADALAGIANGTIQDGKTIMLLQHVALHLRCTAL
ncbi:nudix-type nucleoside diphosphatase (YffH/AdpP family) [Acidovorax sp. 30]|nr:nudix-type nucleoside diphosphatase (YffH/AdpP family) [Acidovorax sp. 59]PKW02925.1 nudix-type nucleoside diphosphatase (YffH/AdpP family) [Acidovorax sp. 30]